MGTFYRIIVFCFSVWVAGSAQAEDLVYRPVNPNFGGNALNGRFLLDQAILQDKNKDPGQPGGSGLSRSTSAESFAERLDRAILSRLSRDLVANAFGEQGIEDGTFDTGINTIVVETTVDATFITITDNETGETTTIEIPFF